ncbi:Uncharacterised protein [Kluyvera intermedia]|nr:hypothetical protein [Kluyvera intermedia]VDZ85607.1 Uncharacterised protein [Kluyvera intermedia]
MAVEWTSTWAGSGVWIIDDRTLSVIATKPLIPRLPAELWQPRQNVAPQAEVQLIPAQNSDYRPQNRYWLRWEALPIFRDVAHEAKTGATLLEVVEFVGE